MDNAAAVELALFLHSESVRFYPFDTHARAGNKKSAERRLVPRKAHFFCEIWLNQRCIRLFAVFFEGKGYLHRGIGALLLPETVPAGSHVTFA